MAKKLDDYRRRRDFARTREPAPRDDDRDQEIDEVADDRHAPLGFVVHAHAARRMHWDLRLELDGVLRSWAVPKGPSLDPADRRLAVETEDHPLEYAGFEGMIPEGEYGAGATLVWDRGVWRADGDPRAALERGRLTFELEGDKLRGAWYLVRTGDGAEPRQWLLMKRHDRGARGGEPIVATRPQSVISGRTLDEVRADGPEAPNLAAPDLGAIDGAARADLPRAITPQLATRVTRPPSGAGWIGELKLDGYRLMAHKDGATVCLRTRRGLDWSARFPAIARAIGALPVERAVLDGELVILDAAGRTEFGALQRALSDPDAPFVFIAFDLLYQDDWDLRDAPLSARKAALRALIGVSRGVIRYGDHLADADLAAFFEEVCALGLEGIVCKQANAPYRSGRSRAWLKLKCFDRQALVVVGYTAPSGRRSGLGALLLAAHDGDGLRYAGKVGTGFDAATLAALRARLESLHVARPPVSDTPRERGVTWVEPELVAEVAFSGWSTAGRLRHPSFLGLREDKAPEDVVLEPSADADATAKTTTTKKKTTVAGVRLTNPDRVLYPAIGLTKIELARYCEIVAPRLVPDMHRRPLTLVRCPSGVDAECFFQKGEGKGAPDAIARVDVGAGDRYFMVEDLASVVGLVQLGAVEWHVWGARVDDLERPDRIVLDLDPGPEVAWPRVAATALILRERLDALGLAPFLRVTGGKGLHVVVPIQPTLGWEEVRTFAHDLARLMVRLDPRHYSAKLAKEGRARKVLVDYLRNARGATAVATWSPRRHAHAPVAAPLAWDDLERAGDAPPCAPTVRAILAGGALPDDDPWSGFDDAAVELTERMRAEIVREAG